MSYFLFLIFGLLPSIIWLLFYLRKDVHPESNLMIIKIFLYGMAIAIPVALLELGIFAGLIELNLPRIFVLILYFFLGVALVEEFFKYLVVRIKVLRDPEFDEPLDAMIYMIIAALGFAGLENILILFHLEKVFPLQEILAVTILRFVGATFLHALCSGVVGYFLALSFFFPKNKIKLLGLGLGIATILHGLYNFSIIEIEGSTKFIFLFSILMGLALFVSLGFKRLKKLKSICKIK